MQRLAIASCVVALVAACQPSSEERGRTNVVTAAAVRPANVNDERLRHADDHAGQWMSHGRTYSEQRFSPLTQINMANVHQLGLAWFGDFDTRRGQESTPLVIDGVLYVSTAWSKVYAYDARTGKELWKYDPKVPGEWGVRTCCDVVNRGLAAWNGKVYIGTIDGRLIALDAATGEQVWSAQTTDPEKWYSITGAPRIAKGKVFIGQAGGEFHQRGYISAYDAETGALLWRWYTVPGNPADGFENAQMEAAAKTWSGEWWKTGGGGTTWDSIVYDPDTNYVLVGTGNGAPWPAHIRNQGGKNQDNLFLSSIVALDADTGEYAWHYQMTPEESWDYDGTQQIMLADLEIDGEKRHVAMQANKNGFFYVLDARTGKLLSAEPFVAGVNWATGIDMKTGRPRINPQARYDKTGEGFMVIPSSGGAHSWHPMSYSPLTGFVYIPAMNGTFPLVASHEDDNPMGQKLSISMTKSFALYRTSTVKPFNEAYLLAWDPVRQKEVWRVPFGAMGRGGGTLATAGGLVFQGNSEHQEFAAFRADNGEKLWSMPAHTGIVAGAVSYEVEGEQYVAVVAGSRFGGNYYSPNYSRVLAFKLGGKAQLPPPVEPPPLVLNPPEQFGTPEVIASGQEHYNRVCATCHGENAQGRGMFPDLRYSAALNSADVFNSIVIDGVLSANGMVSFKSALTAEQVDAIRAFVVSRAHVAKNAPAGFGFGAPGGRRGAPPSQSAQPRSNPQPH